MSPGALPEGVRSSFPPVERKNTSLKVGDNILGSLWVLEWSQGQQCFHVETLVDCLSQNIRSFYNGGQTGDYVILGLFPSREAVDGFYDQLLARMRLWGLSHYTSENIDHLLNG